MQTKAKEFASQLGETTFKASTGFIDRFKHRHGLSCKTISGESSAAPVQIANQFKEQIPTIIQGPSAKDIYNLDELGLFFRLCPSKSLTYKGDTCHGGKLSKERITVLLCCNMDGTHKLLPVVIGKSKRPRCFANVKQLPVTYYANRKAWMNAEIWTGYVHWLDKIFRKQNRQILLFIDNCLAHPKLPNLTNITIHFLPPNTTSIVQPLDQGIIRAFKAHYRSILTHRLISDFDNQKKISVSLKDACDYVAMSWSRISSNTIGNCFRHAGFIFDNTQLQDQEDTDTMLAESETPSLWNEFTHKLNQTLTFHEFLDFDDGLVVNETLSEKEIVEMVSTHQNNMESDDEEEEVVNIPPTPSLNDAIAALEVVQSFVQSKEESLRSLQEVISLRNFLAKQANKTQSLITDFFNT